MNPCSCLFTLGKVQKVTHFGATFFLQEVEQFPPGIQFFLETPVAAGINAAILILVVVAARNLLGAGRRLKRERTGLKRLKQSRPDADKLQGLLSDGSFADTLAGGRVQVFQTGGRRQDLELLAASDSEELHQEVALARGISGAVVLLGLAGTLVGLSLGVGPLVRVLQNRTPDMSLLWEAMGESVSGLATAFSTTLSGVVGALVLGGWLTLYQRKCGRYLVALERASLSVLLPAYSAGDAEDLSEAVDKIDQVRESFEGRFGELTRELEKRGVDLSDRVSTGFDDATAEIIRGFRSVIEPFEQVRDATLQLVGKPAKDAEPLADQVERLGKAGAQLERSVASVEQLIPDLRDTLIATFREQSEATRESLEGHYQRMAEQVSDQAESTRRLSEEVRKSSESVATVVESLEDFSSAADEYRRVWAEVAGSVQDAERTLDTRLTEMSQSVEDSLGSLIAQQASVQQRVLNSLAQFETQLTDAIEAVERERRRSVSRSEELIRELRDAVKDAIREIDTRSEEQQDRVGKAIRHGIENLKLELRDVLEPTRQKRPTLGDGSGGRSEVAASPKDPDEADIGGADKSPRLEDIFDGDGADSESAEEEEGSEDVGPDG